MPFANSRLTPLAFWVGFLALGLATSSSHDKRPAGEANRKHELSLASAAKRLPAPGALGDLAGIRRSRAINAFH